MTLSPLARRRIAIFRASRRGYWSLWIFLALFGLSLCAEVIANDQPLVVRYDGRWYFPVLVSYPETAFGGVLPTRLGRCAWNGYTTLTERGSYSSMRVRR